MKFAAFYETPRVFGKVREQFACARLDQACCVDLSALFGPGTDPPNLAFSCANSRGKSKQLGPPIALDKQKSCLTALKGGPSPGCLLQPIISKSFCLRLCMQLFQCMARNLRIHGLPSAVCTCTPQAAKGNLHQVMLGCIRQAWERLVQAKEWLETSNMPAAYRRAGNQCHDCCFQILRQGSSAYQLAGTKEELEGLMLTGTGR